MAHGGLDVTCPLYFPLRSEYVDQGYHTKSGCVHALPLVSVYEIFRDKEIQPLCEILSRTTAYYIWKALCSLAFHQVWASLTELVKSIWLDMVHTLKGRWDCIVGDSDDKFAQRHQFLILWTTTPLMTSKNGTTFWHFQPPKWFSFVDRIEIKTL